jgi:hypothetical protein
MATARSSLSTLPKRWSDGRKAWEDRADGRDIDLIPFIFRLVPTGQGWLWKSIAKAPAHAGALTAFGQAIGNRRKERSNRAVAGP